MMRLDAVREYLRASLWIVPTVCGVAAMGAGLLIARVRVRPDSLLAFQGTADDARTLLITVAGTVVTVLALLLGLTVVALQLSSTQFSPRLLRNFLRDRSNQLVLGVIVGTFTYSAAGLFTVGVSRGERTTDFPRLAVSVAIALLFVSMALLVYFADHLAHSIQVDTIMRMVEQETLPVIDALPGAGGPRQGEVPGGARLIAAARSGYVQTVDAPLLLRVAAEHRVSIRIRPIVGEHLVAGTALAWVWGAPPGDPDRASAALPADVNRAVRIGFERTLEQDAGFGLRRLIDIACKALSPAVNDPYTAVQAIHHLAVLCARLAARPLGHQVMSTSSAGVTVIIPAPQFSDYLTTTIGLIRRYGAAEPTVAQALLRLLDTCARVSIDDEGGRRWARMQREADTIVAAARRAVTEPVDLGVVYTEARRVSQTLARRHAGRPADTDQRPPATHR
jgi:uncharacterized membrane protein